MVKFEEEKNWNIINKDKLSIGGKQFTNKEINKQTIRQ